VRIVKQDFASVIGWIRVLKFLNSLRMLQDTSWLQRINLREMKKV